MVETDVYLPTHHLRMAFRVMGNSPEFLDRVISGSGLTLESLQSPQFQLPASALWAMSENVASILGAGWFLNFPLLWGFEVQSEFGLAIRSAPDLGSAMKVLVDHYSARWPIAHVRSRQDNKATVLEIESVEPISTVNWQFASAVAMLNFQTVLGSISPDVLGTVKIRFKGDVPAYVDQLAKSLRIAFSWNNAEFEVEIPNDIMALPSNFRDEHTYNQMMAILRDESRISGRTPSVRLKVRGILSNVGTGRIGVEAIASAIGLSSRTLERRLLLEGTSLRELQDESLKIRFHEFVANPGNPSAAQVAFKLGYKDAASLSRACKRWFGMTFQAARIEMKRRGSASAMPLSGPSGAAPLPVQDTPRLPATRSDASEREEFSQATHLEPPLS